MNALKRLYIRLDDRATNAALDINDNHQRLATTCTIHHRVPRGAWMALAGAAAATLAANRRTTGPLAVIAAAAGVAQTVISRAHEIAVAYPGHPCPRCPQPDEADHGDGDGGVWLDTGWDDIPPAPGPMADYTDEQIATWAGDLEPHMFAVHNTEKDVTPR